MGEGRTDQFFVREALAEDVPHDRFEADPVITVTAVVVTKHLFVDVSEEMERLYRDICSGQSPLEHCPKVLDTLSVNMTANVSFGMVDNLVSKVDAFVGVKLICNHGGIGVDVILNNLMQDGPCTLSNHASADAATTLQHANNDSLTLEAVWSDESLSALLGMHVLNLATNKGSIHLDNAGHGLGVIFLHGETNALEHEPRSLLCDMQIPVDFIAANAVLAVREHPHRTHPLIKSDGAVFHHGADFDGELLLASLAEPIAARRYERMFFRATPRTRHKTLMPTEIHGISKAAISV